MRVRATRSPRESTTAQLTSTPILPAAALAASSALRASAALGPGVCAEGATAGAAGGDCCARAGTHNSAALKTKLTVRNRADLTRIHTSIAQRQRRLSLGLARYSTRAAFAPVRISTQQPRYRRS